MLLSFPFAFIITLDEEKQALQQQKKVSRTISRVLNQNHFSPSIDRRIPLSTGNITNRFDRKERENSGEANLIKLCSMVITTLYGLLSRI